MDLEVKPKAGVGTMNPGHSPQGEVPWASRLLNLRVVPLVC